MPTYVNSDSHRRVWPSLTHPESQSTLVLDPGEEVTFRDTVTAPFLSEKQHPIKPAPKQPAEEPAEGEE